SCGSAIDADGDTHSCFLTFSTALFFMATPWSWWTVFGDLIIRPPWSRRYFTISTGGGASPGGFSPFPVQRLTPKCIGGTCVTPPCDIGGTVYASGTSNPSNVCESCMPAVSTSAWSSVSGASLPCGNTCVNEQTDPANCGACGAQCTVTGQMCQAGACACPAGDLQGGSTCVNPQTDSNNCGA